MTPKRYFVTGTGTGVGKTFVTCRLAKLARARGLEVVAHKPIETGCSLVDGKRRGEDQALLRLASSEWLQSMEEAVQFGSYQLELPVAPAVAAVHENIEIDLERIERVLERASRTPTSRPVDLLLVEGAGGWRVPISDRFEMRDLARLVNASVVVVASATLGTINHSLLTIGAIEADGFDIAALVLSNRPDDAASLVQSNIVEIRKRWSGRVLTLERVEELM